MKRCICAICLTVLLLSLSFGVCAGTTQNIALTSFGDAVMLSAKEAPAAWECPELRAGEALRNAGTLKLSNETNATRTISLEYVALPYDNDEALEYLNHVNITIREGAHVLYDGTYTRINDKNGLVLHYALQPHTAVDLSIDLRCDYAFHGAKTGFEDGALIDWKFYTVMETEVENKAEAFSDPALREIILAAVVALLLLVGVGVYEIVKRQKRR